MSYDPSQAQGARAVQIDINGGVTLSDDITVSTSTSFASRNKYFIESKLMATVSAGSGLILFYNWAGFQWAGATVRGNAVTGTNTMTDDLWIGSNTPGSTISMQSSTTGSATFSVANSSFITAYWRIQ